ncbi:hypothetical protein PIB30_068320 [Stylosanthes scabra]|uniref:Uncharacterized protein n=1 Tax=Stylosanthes scabra TaxID=79078 RepID=A0ABU6TNM1_9FABA|nr:hypothetical protein [Stylosanthes scabra]
MLLPRPDEKAREYFDLVGFGQMTITLEDVPFQLGLSVNGDPVSGCLGDWARHYQGRGIIEHCQEAFGQTPGVDVRQGWAVNIN